MASIKQKLKQKILKKEKISLKDKLLLEKIENMSEEEIITQLLVKKLHKIKKWIENLEQKELNWTASKEELKQLEHLIKKKNEIINKIKELRKEELSISDFSESEFSIFNWEWLWNFFQDIWKESSIEFTIDNIIELIFDN